MGESKFGHSSPERIATEERSNPAISNDNPQKDSVVVNQHYIHHPLTNIQIEVTQAGVSIGGQD